MGVDGKEALLEQYETRVGKYRTEFRNRLVPFFSERNPRVLAGFLINFCSLGVGMTEPVPGWIRRAGEATSKQGFEELGTKLIHHAAHEEGHHHMMINDTKSLVQWWNSNFTTPLSAESFLTQAPSPGVVAYRDLHENCIRGEAPYGQIAIEYEIERVSVDWGPQLFAFLAQNLGPEILQHLSFVAEHAAIDIGHTQYNQRAMADFLGVAPKALDNLVEAGARALDCYAMFLEDAMSLGRRQAMAQAAHEHSTSADLLGR